MWLKHRARWLFSCLFADCHSRGRAGPAAPARGPAWVARTHARVHTLVPYSRARCMSGARRAGNIPLAPATIFRPAAARPEGDGRAGARARSAGAQSGAPGGRRVCAREQAVGAGHEPAPITCAHDGEPAVAIARMVRLAAAAAAAVGQSADPGPSPAAAVVDASMRVLISIRGCAIDRGYGAQFILAGADLAVVRSAASGS